MKNELRALFLAAAVVGGCASGADASFIKTAKYGIEIVEGRDAPQEILDCYSDTRPTIIYSKPPEIKGSDFKCVVEQGLSNKFHGPILNSKGDIDILVENAKPIRGDVEEIYPK